MSRGDKFLKHGRFHDMVTSECFSNVLLVSSLEYWFPI